MEGGSTTTGRTGQPSSAEEYFYSRLMEVAEGEDLDIETLCADRPDLAEQLRIFHRRYCNAQEVLQGLAGDDYAGGDGSPEDGVSFDARYTVRGEIAHGGMGAILEVWDEKLRRNLAMKVLRTSEVHAGPLSAVAYQRHQSRLLNEAQILAQLEHPGIVPVYDAGRNTRGELYFTMLEVRGRDLGEIIAQMEGDQGWSLTRAIGVILRVCEAMAHAHSRGAIHRDLKPANVMVGPFGETYVMDWGLAKARGRVEHADIRLRGAAAGTPVEDRSEPLVEATGVSPSIRTDRREKSDSDPGSPLLTVEGDVVGTPAYMSPEQAEGRVEEVDERSDVYSVGAMLYHLLCGQAPYAAEGERRTSREVLELVLQGPPSSPSRLAPPRS